MPRKAAAAAPASIVASRSDRGSCRNLARQRARDALRIVRKQELAARRVDPATKRLVRQQVYRSFFRQLFAASRAQ
jgi:hypothetical protein